MFWRKGLNNYWICVSLYLLYYIPILNRTPIVFYIYIINYTTEF